MDLRHGCAANTLDSCFKDCALNSMAINKSFLADNCKKNRNGKTSEIPYQKCFKKKQFTTKPKKSYKNSILNLLKLKKKKKKPINSICVQQNVPQIKMCTCKAIKNLLLFQENLNIKHQNGLIHETEKKVNRPVCYYYDVRSSRYIPDRGRSIMTSQSS